MRSNYFDKIITVLTLCSYHVTYAFQSKFTLYSCLNVKELLARSRREIRTHNHLIYKRTLNHSPKLANWLSCVVSTYLCGAFHGFRSFEGYCFNLIFCSILFINKKVCRAETFLGVLTNLRERSSRNQIK